MYKLVSENINEYTKYLEGGKADDLSDYDMDEDQLLIGTAVEMEHTNDRGVAREIAMDHLAEDEEYYTKLIQAGLADEPEALALYKELISK